MGLHLMENFNTPFLARNVKDFWNRWHISMSSWFRDYLYIPLGGNRCSKRRYYFNLFLTFLASGLWHGAAFKYIVWGGVNGLLQVINRLWKPYRDRLFDRFHIKDDGPVKYLEMVISYITFTLTLIIFRANSLSLAGEYALHTITRPDFKQFFTERTYRSLVSDRDLLITFAAIILLLAVGIIRKKMGKTLDVFLMERSYPVRAFVMLFLLFYILLFGQYGEDVYTKPFVYFQF
jgi:D-alanyl-lipoteichoic acid acyltransferase DltB (MBOAT superfamily)